MEKVGDYVEKHGIKQARDHFTKTNAKEKFINEHHELLKQAQQGAVNEETKGLDGLETKAEQIYKNTQKLPKDLNPEVRSRLIDTAKETYDETKIICAHARNVAEEQIAKNMENSGNLKYSKKAKELGVYKDAKQEFSKAKANTIHDFNENNHEFTDEYKELNDLRNHKKLSKKRAFNSSDYSANTIDPTASKKLLLNLSTEVADNTFYFI